jgi:hypothetical protein
MKLTRRDLIATVCVAVGTLAAVMWLAGMGSQGITGARVVTGIVLALGFVASASAVVPGFLDLMHGSKLYLVTTSALGLAALVAGIFALIDGEEAMLGALVGATVVLWAISTWHHVRFAEGRTPAAT